MRARYLHSEIAATKRKSEQSYYDYRALGKSQSESGRVMEVLGYSGEVRAEMLSVIREYKLPQQFPEIVTAEAKTISTVIATEEIKKRLDLREKIIVTIDPEDAKDFDDAVSLEILASGNYELGVHIADVSHFVTEGSALDTEALKRGTSVYLADMVVPMLPENISNNICSLKPLEDRLTYSILMEISPRGVVKNYAIKIRYSQQTQIYYEEANNYRNKTRRLCEEILLMLN